MSMYDGHEVKKYATARRILGRVYRVFVELAIGFVLLVLLVGSIGSYFGDNAGLAAMTVIFCWVIGRAVFDEVSPREDR